MGIENEGGSLEVGKKADLIIVDMAAIGLMPNTNPVSNLVYAGGGQYVDTVIVDGRPLMREKQLLTLDEDKIRQKALEHSDALIKRSGVTIEPKWPIT